MGLDLKGYLGRYHEMFKRDDGLPYDIPSIEARFLPLRDGRRSLTADYVTWLLDLEIVKRIRNAAVHGLDPQPTGREVSWMIDEIGRICSPWELGPDTQGTD